MAINEQISPIGHNRGDKAEITYHDFLRTGPDTIGGRYLRSFWQPIMRGEDIEKGRAKPVRIMSEDFADLPRRERQSLCHRAALRASRRQTFGRLGRGRGHQMRLSRLGL